MENLFVTGTYRSGTTLVEKILHAIDRVSVASQPLPLLYIEAKRAFLSELGFEAAHPLGHLFLEDRYSRGDFHQFLDSYRMRSGEVDRLFDALQAADGCWSPELLNHRDRIAARGFLSMRRQAMRLLAEIYGKTDAEWAGSKEILCEEYIPYLLEHREHVILVIRDPHAVLESVYLGRGPTFTGRVRPVLFHLRNWRKSVAFALAFRGAPGFACVRYEDVVRDPQHAMSGVTALLGRDPTEIPDLGNLRDQSGRPWTGNSSFAGKNATARPPLSKGVSRYIDTLCRPEMTAMGYKARTDGCSWKELEQLEEPLRVTDPRLPDGYSTDPTNLRHEQQRLDLVLSGQAPEDVERWFIHEKSYERLVHAMKSPGRAPEQL